MNFCWHLHKRHLSLTFTVVALTSLATAGARADASVALGTQGALARAGQTQDALKNGTAASFGSPVTDDRRLFKLRWRLPWSWWAGAAWAPRPLPAASLRPP